jgi:hypothetical protein
MLALAQDPDAGLPACCRRHGQHHCAMLDDRGDSSAHRFVAVCPAWPQHAVPSPIGARHFVPRTASAAISLRSSFSASRPLEAGRLTACEHLHPKRGPPISLLA